MSAADATAPVGAAEAAALFADLASFPVLVLAVSGGPDSTALLLLAARWRAAREGGPRLVAITVDHGLRPQAVDEATAVAGLASRLGIEHRILHWTGRKPATGLQQAARLARYRLLGEAARAAGATHVLTAHTRDDQAETVLFRLASGSGIGGLRGMARIAPLPCPPAAAAAAGSGPDILLVRPFLDLAKARLIATLAQAGIAYADDPSNGDPRFTRTRLRALMPKLAAERLDAGRLALLATRAARADAALEAAVAEASARLSHTEWSKSAPIMLDPQGYAALPAEVALRLLGRAIATVGDAPAELGKLEALYASLKGWQGSDGRTFRRTLAGALVTRRASQIVVERAPPRRRTGSCSAPGTYRFR